MAVTLMGGDEHGDPLDRRMGQVGCGRTGDQRGTCADELRLRNTSANGTGVSSEALGRPLEVVHGGRAPRDQDT